MKILAVVLVALVVALFVFITPADAKRGGGKERRCSTRTHELVVERDEPVPFKLCAFPRDDDR